jgi:hypothetical protein
MQPWLAPDFIHNADKAISLPGLLARAPIVEAGCAACLLTMAAGPRVWGYEAGLMLPILAWSIAGGLSEPWRTRLIFLVIPLGLLWLVSLFTVVSGVALVVAAATAMWLWRWRPLGPNPLVAAAD